MRKTVSTLALLAVVPVLAAAQDVSVNYDKTYDFSKIKTSRCRSEARPRTRSWRSTSSRR
jgi:hypothetical protein